MSECVRTWLANQPRVDGKRACLGNWGCCCWRNHRCTAAADANAPAAAAAAAAAAADDDDDDATAASGAQLAADLDRTMPETNGPILRDFSDCAAFTGLVRKLAKSERPKFSYNLRQRL